MYSTSNNALVTFKENKTGVSETYPTIFTVTYISGYLQVCFLILTNGSNFTVKTLLGSRHEYQHIFYNSTSFYLQSCPFHCILSCLNGNLN